MFRITIEEIVAAATEGRNQGPDQVVERLRQTVDVIDLPGVMRAINTKPRAPRVRKSAIATSTTAQLPPPQTQA